MSEPQKPSSENPEKAQNEQADEDILTGETSDLDNDLLKLHQERDTLFNQLARVQADFKNAQKRLESEKLVAIQYANSRVIQSLLPILDNFDRALEVDPAKTDAASMLKGMQLIKELLMKALADQHVQVIKPQPGDPFDPNLHQALMQQPDDRYTEPTIVQLYQPGYLHHDRILRPAQVVVGKKA